MTKPLLLSCVLMLSGLALQAQSMPSKKLSPPAEAIATIDDLQIAINYSQPGVKGRTIWGFLVPYEKVWRTGANEATTFQVNKDVLIEDQPLAAGKYALFTIPGKDAWTIIFNKEADQWGAYNYDKAKDALRVKVPVLEADFSERMTFHIESAPENRAKVNLIWGTRAFAFELEPASQP